MFAYRLECYAAFYAASIIASADAEHNNIDPCPRAAIERTDWEDLNESEQRCLLSRGWTEGHWDCGWLEEEFLPWSELLPRRRAAALARRWTEEEWEAHRTGPPCFDDAVTADVKDFLPVKIKVAVPELQSLTMDRLVEMYDEVSMRLVGGDAAVEGASEEESGGCGYATEEFLAEGSMGDFIASVKAGDTKHYIHLEEAMKEKELLWEGVGKRTVDSLKEVVSSDPYIRGNGTWREDYSNFEDQDFDWAMFVGAKGTNTHMHYDTDTFNFLYLVEGRKRVVIIPNDKRTSGMYDIRTNADGGTGWVEENILGQNYSLPAFAVDITLEAGEGIAIPFLAWHAVENLEASLAFSIRIV